MKSAVWIREILLLSLPMLFAASATAGGLYLTELGTPSSLGSAGAANPTNTFTADAAFTNPAGMTGLKTREFLSGFQAVIPWIEFDSSLAEKGGNDGHNAGIFSAIPSAFYVQPLGERARLGFALTAPLGGGTDFGDQFVGRYSAIKVQLAGMALSSSLAYQLTDRLSVGGGVSLLYTLFDQSIAINQGPLPDGKVKLDNADDWGFQPYFGVTYALSERALLGLVYRAEADVNLKGDLNFRNLAFPTPPANQFKLSWDNPQLLEIGLRYKLTDQWRLFVNADWEDWSEFSQNQLAFQEGLVNPVVTLDRNLKDTWHIGIAAARQMENSVFGVGFGYDSSFVSNKDRTIDLPVDQQFRLSSSYAWKGPKKLDFALGATLLYAGKGKTDQTAQRVRFRGEFDRNLVLFLGGTLRYNF